MKATEARALAYKKNINDTNSQYAKIIEKIIFEAKKGNYNMDWYESFNDVVREKLESQGYIVGKTHHDQRDGSTTKIKW